jgi:Tol biopolymer transport system component
MGTVAYMSPEQAEGRKVDTRSDVFSFGAVLYEMTTGQAAFKGDTGASTVAAILRDEPTPARNLAPEIPRELDWVIGLCLKKAPQRRWQSMSDLKVALEEARDKLAGGKAEESVAEVVKPERRGLPRFWWAAVLAGLALAAIVGGYWGRSTAPLHDAVYERLTYRRGDVTSARFTPDGQTIIYSAEWDNAPSTIYSTRAGSRESRSLGFPPGKILSLSPTGEMAILGGTLANTFDSGILSRAPLAGGAPREFLANVIDADWADESNLAVIRSFGAKTRVEFPVGKVVYEVEGRRPPFDPRVSPNREGLAFFQFDGEVGDYALMYVPRGGTPRILTRGWRGVGRSAWSPDGSEVWFVASVPGGDPALRAVTLSGRERVVAHTLGWMVLDDVSRDGRVLATRLNSRIAMFFGRAGDGEEHDLSWLDTSAIFDISPDGKNILFEELSYGEGRNPAIYLRKSDDSPAVHLGNCSRPSLSPDGKSVACVHSEGRVSNLILLPVGAGEVRQLPNDGFRYEQVEWLPDGQRILFSGSQNGAAPRNFIEALNGSGGPKAVTEAGVTVRRVSPDGKMAVGIRDGGLFLHQLDDGSSKRIGAAEPGELAIRWAADQRSIFTSVPKGGASFQVYRVDAATGQRKLWKELKPPDPVGVTMFSLTVTPNGEAYVYSYQRDLADLYLITGLR